MTKKKRPQKNRLEPEMKHNQPAVKNQLLKIYLYYKKK